MQKIFKKLCSQPKDNDCKVEDICDNKEIGAIVEEEPEYNIQTVINQDFISTWVVIGSNRYINLLALIQIFLYRSIYLVHYLFSCSVFYDSCWVGFFPGLCAIVD